MHFYGHHIVYLLNIITFCREIDLVATFLTAAGNIIYFFYFGFRSVSKINKLIK